MFGTSVLTVTSVPTPVAEPQAAKYRPGQWVLYGAPGKAVKEWFVVWTGPCRLDPTIIKVGLKNCRNSRMRPFYLDQNRVSPSV